MLAWLHSGSRASRRQCREDERLSFTSRVSFSNEGVWVRLNGRERILRDRHIEIRVLLKVKPKS